VVRDRVSEPQEGRHKIGARVAGVTPVQMKGRNGLTGGGRHAKQRKKRNEKGSARMPTCTQRAWKKRWDFTTLARKMSSQKARITAGTLCTFIGYK